MAKDVLITPLDGEIQFSSSAGVPTGQIKVDGDDLVISNLVGDVLLGDGTSDIFIGDGSSNVDIVFEQNGEIRDDGSGKTITLGSKTTTLILSSSSDITMQGGGGNVGIGTSTAGEALEVVGNISASGTIIGGGLNINGTTTFNDGDITNVGVIDVDTIRGDAATNVQIDLGTAGMNFRAEEGDKFTFNEGENSVDLLYFNSDESNFVFFDASTSKVGIGDDISQTPAKTLTVKGDISASGDLFVNNITASAGNFSTHITASGDISSSGTIDANVFTIQGNPGISMIGDVVTFGQHIGDLQIGKNTTQTTLTVASHITASGNISASGDGLGHTLGGRVSINYGNGGSMTGSLSNGEGFGEIVEFGVLNSVVTKGDVVIYRTNSHGWIRADKDTDYQTWSWMGVCIDPAADGSTSFTEPKILLKGVVRLGAGHIADSGGDEGDPVYLQDDGHVTFAAPSTSGDYARIVGYVIDESQDIIYLDPDKTWVEIA